MVRDSRPKDPAKVAAGFAGSLSRWGVRRVVRLDEFDADERAAIAAAIEARRAAKRAREAEIGQAA